MFQQAADLKEEGAELKHVLEQLSTGKARTPTTNKIWSHGYPDLFYSKLFE